MAYFVDIKKCNNRQNKEDNEFGTKHETTTDSRVLYSDLLAEFENRESNDDVHKEQVDENCTTVSHLPSQQFATPTIIKKQGPFWLWLGLSDDNEKNKDRKLTICKWLNENIVIL